MTKYTQLLELALVKKLTGYRSTQSIYNLMERENFPRPIAVGTRSKRWVAAEVEGWIQDRIEASRAAA